MKLVVLASLFVGVVGCGSSQDAFEPGTGPSVSDAALFALSATDASWTFYKRSATPIIRSSTPHPESRALVRYNTRAASQLDGAGQSAYWCGLPRFLHYRQRTVQRHNGFHIRCDDEGHRLIQRRPRRLDLG